MSKELRACPFCGDKNTNIGSDGYGGWYIDCSRMHIFHYCKCSEEHAIQLWNTRPAENALRSENARLKELIKEILNVADDGLDIGIEFLRAGLDGMTGGVEEWEDMKRARRKVRKLAKEALKNNNTNTEKG